MRKHYILVEVTMPTYLGGNGRLPNHDDMAGQVRRALESYYRNGRRSFRTVDVISVVTQGHDAIVRLSEPFAAVLS